MTDYAKFEIQFTYSGSSDYTSPLSDPPAFLSEGTPTKRYENRVQATTGGITIDLGLFSAIDELFVKNLDATNYVAAVWRTGDGSTNDQSKRIPAGRVLLLPGTDFTLASDLTLTANGASCYCDVIITGS